MAQSSTQTEVRLCDQTWPERPAPIAADMARGIGRLFGDLGYASLTEFTLRSRRRVDLIGLDRRGRIAIVEIKTSLEDFRADRKWPAYLDYCDRFFFAVPDTFPVEILPKDCGLLLADGYGSAIRREGAERNLNPARRRALILSFGRTAARRLRGHTDPGLSAVSPPVGRPLAG